MRLGLLLAFVGLLAATPCSAAERVDLELVLAVDVSMSMDLEEQALQRQGYAAAIVDPDVVQRITSGPLGRIAVTYVEWAGAGEQRTVVPWQIVDGPAAAATFAETLRRAPISRIRRTSISDVILFAANELETNDFEGLRRVIDISGDGPNNQGLIVTQARDRAVDRGITINGLPLMFNEAGPLGIKDLDAYYRACVVGGAGAFTLPVRTREGFSDAIRRKLAMEVAGEVPGSVIRAATDDVPPISCTIGEYLWRQMFGN